MKIESTENIKKKERIHICLLGESKSGKTKVIETLEGRTLIGNADKGLLSLKGSKNIDSVTLNNFQDVIDFMKYIKSDKNDYDNIVIDSISVIGDFLIKFLEAKDVKGFDLWKAYSQYIAGIITTLRDSDKFNSISIFELVEKENASGLLEKGFGLQGSLASRIPYFYDFVFAMRKKATKDGLIYKIQTHDKDGYKCGYRGEGLETFEEQDLGKLIKKIRS